MINAEDFARIIGMHDNLIEVDEVAYNDQDPMAIHSDLGRRLNAFPRQNWIAFVYDKHWGLLFVYKVRFRWLGVVYTGVDVTNACIMMQYAAVVHFKTPWLQELLRYGYGQVAITWINGQDSLSVHRDTQIPFPLPQTLGHNNE